MDTNHQARALAAALNQRMDQLALDQRSLSQRSGVAPATIRALQGGEDGDHHPRTLSRLAGALEWPSEAFLRILSAVPAETTSEDSIVDLAAASDDDLLVRLATLEDELVELRRAIVERVVTTA